MKTGNEEGAASAFGGLKVSWATGLWILLLTLAVWIFFYMQQAQLDAASTAVVALFVTVVVLSVQWTLARFRRYREDRSGVAK